MKRSIPIFCVGICLVLLLQAVLMPKNIPEARLIGEYYANASGNDVIFVGDCEVYENISPITLYEEFGIASWIRGSPQQTVWQSFYLVEETLRYESPKAIVFNVLAMKYDTPESTGNPVRREAYNRITLDTMRWSGSKFRSIMASMTEAERKSLGLAGYLFPILRYHDRWSQLTWRDVTTLVGTQENVTSRGYLVKTDVVGAPTSHPSHEGALPPVDTAFGETALEWFDRIVTLCRENEAALVLVKAPTDSWRYPWYDEYEEQVVALTEKYELPYYNLLDAFDEIGLDLTTDSYDGGLHLNVYGAEKVSRYFSSVLKERYQLRDGRRWNGATAMWTAIEEQYEAMKGEVSEP